MEKKLNAGISIEAGATGAFKLFADPKFKAGYNYDDKNIEAFNEAVASGQTKEIFVGGAPFKGGDTDAWYQGLKTTMVPIGSKTNILRPVSSLLESLHFPDDPEIELKRKVVEEVMSRVCDYYSPCTYKPEDP